MSIHPAFKYSFDELYKGLENEVVNGNVIKKSQDDLTLYRYTKHCSFERNWNDFTLSARGIVLCPEQKKIVALPFPKFFNYGEMAIKVPNESFTITEKMDGSLGIIYYHNNEWRVNTITSFNSPQAMWAKKWLKDNINDEYLHKNVTYLVEIIYPANRIVINYNYSGLVLLSAYNNFNGEEQGNWVLKMTSIYSGGFKRPEFYDCSIEQLLEVCKSLSLNEEGFVVKFQNGLRMKFKGDEYCRAHAVIAQITPLNVWELLLNKDNLDNVRMNIPEEFVKDFNTIVKILKKKLYTIMNRMAKIRKEIMNMSDKELGLMIQDKHQNKYDKNEIKLIFAAKDGKLFREIKKPGRVRQAVFNIFRPDNNILDGYTPSSVMNLFAEEGM